MNWGVNWLLLCLEHFTSVCPCLSYQPCDGMRQVESSDIGRSICLKLLTVMLRGVMEERKQHECTSVGMAAGNAML